jgi:uncharacterized protein (TIGR00369 family)
MTKPNKLQRAVKKIEGYPKAWYKPLLSLAIGRKVPFVGTAGIRFEKMTTEEVVITLKNRKKVRNHIKQIHAAASALLAETATGMMVGMNLPDDKLPLMKTMKVNYVKRSQGAMKAVATLTPEQVELLHTQDKGEVLVKVTVTDEAGVEPVECEMLWAWIPKNKKKPAVETA